MIEKHQQLVDDIMSSYTLKGYNWLNHLYQRSKHAVTLAFIISLIVPFIELVFLGDFTQFSYTLDCIIWFPAIAFAFVLGGFHIAAGIKLKALATKYELEVGEISVISNDVLN